MHSMTVDCDTFSSEEKDAVDALATNIQVEITGSKGARLLELHSSVSVARYGNVGKKHVFRYR